ncbi:MAG: hypothetical protein M0P73_04890 [Syntrophobacterales bacterium]|nr:hypothetical protein [Syntrophobacterales bacterium]
MPVAREWQAVIVESNLEPNRLTYSIADHFLPGSAGKLLPLVLQEL